MWEHEWLQPAPGRRLNSLILIVQQTFHLRFFDLRFKPRIHVQWWWGGRSSATAAVNVEVDITIETPKSENDWYLSVLQAVKTPGFSKMMGQKWQNVRNAVISRTLDQVINYPDNPTC